jgi:hypothetical protein
MANPQNLIPQAHVLTVEEASKGGKASVEARNKRKEQIELLKRLLDEPSKSGKTYGENITLGLIRGAMQGKAENYKTIMEYIDDTTQASGTPSIEIRVIDNSNLEKAMYDNNDKV